MDEQDDEKRAEFDELGIRDILDKYLDDSDLDLDLKIYKNLLSNSLTKKFNSP